jgi:hypothetical protein
MGGGVARLIKHGIWAGYCIYLSLAVLCYNSSLWHYHHTSQFTIHWCFFGCFSNSLNWHRDQTNGISLSLSVSNSNSSGLYRTIPYLGSYGSTAKETPASQSSCFCSASTSQLPTKLHNCCPGKGTLDACPNIKMDLKKIGWVGKDWTDLTQGRDQWRALVNMTMNLQVPYNDGKLLSNWWLLKKGSAPCSSFVRRNVHSSFFVLQVTIYQNISPPKFCLPYMYPSPLMYLRFHNLTS